MAARQTSKIPKPPALGRALPSPTPCLNAATERTGATTPLPAPSPSRFGGGPATPQQALFDLLLDSTFKSSVEGAGDAEGSWLIGAAQDISPREASLLASLRHPHVAGPASTENAGEPCAAEPSVRSDDKSAPSESSSAGLDPFEAGQRGMLPPCVARGAAAALRFAGAALSLRCHPVYQRTAQPVEENNCSAGDRQLSARSCSLDASVGEAASSLDAGGEGGDRGWAAQPGGGQVAAHQSWRLRDHASSMQPASAHAGDDTSEYYSARSSASGGGGGGGGAGSAPDSGRSSASAALEQHLRATLHTPASSAAVEEWLLGMDECLAGLDELL